MKAAEFSFARPETIDEVLTLLRSADGDARLLAGGQSLVPMLHMRLVQPSLVIDLGRVDGLSAGDIDGAWLRVGAMTRYSRLERDPLVAANTPLLTSAVRLIGDRQVRNCGTLGGSICQADPVGEMPLVALALDAEVLVRSDSTERTIPIDEFLIGAYSTDLDETEMVEAIRFPLGPHRAIIKEITRRHNDFAVVSIAITAIPVGDLFTNVRVAISGIDDRAILADDAMAILEGTTLDDTVIATAVHACVDLGDPATDVRASADYRRRLIEVHLRRTLERFRDGRGTVGV